MAVPFEKLPELLKIPFMVPKFTKLRFIYPYHLVVPSNTIRLFYKQKAPLIKYYNPYTSLILEFTESRDPSIEVFREETMIHNIANGKSSDQILAELREIHDKLN